MASHHGKKKGPDYCFQVTLSQASCHGFLPFNIMCILNRHLINGTGIPTLPVTSHTPPVSLKLSLADVLETFVSHPPPLHSCPSFLSQY